MRYQVSRLETDGKASSTGPLMHEMVRCYHRDMLPWASMSLPEIFSLIASIPFRPDPEDEELLMRPMYTMNGLGNGGDCDDKCIALASWAYLNAIPYRFLAVRRPEENMLHHVVCELYIQDSPGLSGRWIHADPTYAFNTLGREREAYAEYVVI